MVSKQERQHKEAICKAVNIICHSLGFKNKTGLHEARRTWCSDLISTDDFTDHEIRLLMGHKDIHTTKKYYDKSKKESVSRVEAVENAVGISLSDLWANVG